MNIDFQTKESKKMKKFFIRILDFLLPPTCPICHQKGLEVGVCFKCFSKLEFIGRQKCSVCGRPLDAVVPGMAVCGSCLKDKPYFHQAEAVFKYNDISKKLILPFKHGDHIDLKNLLVKWMSVNSAQLIERNNILIPVPLHWSRLLKRKYNQSALLAKTLAQKHNKIYNPFVLIRIKRTKSQGHLSLKERKKNVKNVFSVKNPECIKGQSVLLIDDVYTTGATINECAKVLLKAGAKNVDVLTFARVVKD